VDPIVRSARQAFSLRGTHRKATGKNIMGDKSPKSAHKQAAQKQAKSNATKQKKADTAAAKQAANPKK
jgi:hypothetical protein